ncbi:hypothetical protein TNIN_486641 [Trichonephila inaurata madagascariensis]|uniref:Uncharacterized protein n=1 Tax=Trichonephila inaurata madagascariensis TaxID=2747483 RepID=A0A8X7CIR9_9ARAC|nr:hypothetical protein TNIN_486641 [Trichonephila inaurata madagascariensis]
MRSWQMFSRNSSLCPQSITVPSKDYVMTTMRENNKFKQPLSDIYTDTENAFSYWPNKASIGDFSIMLLASENSALSDVTENEAPPRIH